MSQAELCIPLKRPALRYYGSKWRIAPWIIAHFPEHRSYVEVFGGGAGVLLRKPRSKVEVYNDLDSQAYRFFSILREPQSLDRLVRLIELTPFSREEFGTCLETSDDPVESARRFVARSFMAHGTCSIDPNDSNGFRSCDIRAGKSYASEWAGVPAALRAVATRMIGVSLENLDFRKLIPKFDDPDTLYYCDPPYPMSTRAAGGKGYVHELTDRDHGVLAWFLRQLKARVIISGYDCPLYQRLYGDWHRAEKKTTANGQSGAVPRTEVIWMNFAPCTP